MTDNTTQQSPDIHPTVQSEWQAVLGSSTDRTWRALAVEPAPAATLRKGHNMPATGWKLALAASIVACIGLLVILQQQRLMIADLTLDKTLMQLQSPVPVIQLSALADLRQLPQDIPASRWPELMDFLQQAHDPNIQLATLELLITIGAVQTQADLPDLSDSPVAQQQFLRASFME